MARQFHVAAWCEKQMVVCHALPACPLASHAITHVPASSAAPTLPTEWLELVRGPNVGLV